MWDKDDFLRLLFFVDIEDLPPAVQEKVFDEVLDRDVQKGRRGAACVITSHPFQSTLHFVF